VIPDARLLFSSDSLGDFFSGRKWNSTSPLLSFPLAFRPYLTAGRAPRRVFFIVS